MGFGHDLIKYKELIVIMEGRDRNESYKGRRTVEKLVRLGLPERRNSESDQGSSSVWKRKETPVVWEIKYYH